MNLRVPEDLDRRLDQLAAEQHTSKSALLLQGAEDALQVVDRYGFHIRDIGLLASALARPGNNGRGRGSLSAVVYEGSGADGVCARFNPLIDGNKRPAWTLMVLMLWIYSHRHDFSTDAAFGLVVGVAAGDVSLEVSAGLIATHLVRR